MRRQLRVSFTFRKVIHEKCQCAFIEYCDWDRNGAMKVPDSDEYGAAIEKQYVSAVKSIDYCFVYHLMQIYSHTSFGLSF